MRTKKKWVTFGIVCVSLVLAMPLMTDCKEKSSIIKRYGEGFLEKKASGLRVLHLKGICKTGPEHYFMR